MTHHARFRSRMLAVFLSSLLVVGLAAPASGADDDQQIIEAPDRERHIPDKPTDGLASGKLRKLVEATQVAGDQQAASEPIVVEILHELPERRVLDLVDGAGGTFLGSVEGVVQASLPADALEDLEAQPGITFLRPPLRVDVPVGEASPELTLLSQVDAVQSGSVVGEHVAKAGAAAWHRAGIRGQGVKVGIIDVFHQSRWNAAQSAGELPAPSGTFCRAGGSNCNVFWVGHPHGNMVAEILHDMAPGAQIYLGYASTVSDLKAVVDYFHRQGVQIISRSMTSEYDGPGNGTGPTASVVNHAVSLGMTWFNSAGNNAGTGAQTSGFVRSTGGTYWRGKWQSSDIVDGYEILRFGPGRSSLGFFCGFVNGLRWNDWGSNRTDYDVYVRNTETGEVTESEDKQRAGAPPLEVFDVDCDPGELLVLEVVKRHEGNGTSNDVLEFMVNGGAFEFWQNPYSASGPVVDSKNPGLVSVGAIEPAAGSSIASFSSRGPTNDGRTKPDITAPSCLSTYTGRTSGQGCFSGTSASAPAAAGAAALIVSSGVVSRPHQVTAWIRQNATADRGAAGADNVFGWGEVRLPAPSTVNPFLDVPNGSTFARDITWLAGRRITLGCNPPANTRYCPDGNVTRGQMAAFLVRALGLQRVGAPFSDTVGHTFETDIRKLAAAGITLGCNPPANTRFCPDQPVTRGQMAAFLVRALKLNTATASFDDIRGHVFALDISRLATARITLGCNPPANTRFCPNAPVTRAQMAAFLRRALE